MGHTFPLFPQLPPEIRQEIWHIALWHSWSFTKLKRINRRLKLASKVSRETSQSCREARTVMQLTHVNIMALGGWIHLERRLFFVRDLKYDRRLLEKADYYCEILACVQHLVINPRDWAYLWDTVDIIKSRCTSLRSLIIVAPWFDPADMPASHSPSSWAPYEDWGQLFRDTPAELDLLPLLDDIESGVAVNSSRNAQYRTRVNEAAQQVPNDVAQFEHVFGRTSRALRRLEEAARVFPVIKPTLYLRTKAELVCFLDFLFVPQFYALASLN